MIQSILIVSTLLLVTACSSRPDQIVVDTKPIERSPLVLPQVDQFSSRDVEWIVITPDNAQEVFDKMQSQGKPIVIFGLTEEGWQSLTLNMADLLKLVQQQKAIITAYEGYYQKD
jgi:hypothetical protein